MCCILVIVLWLLSNHNTHTHTPPHTSRAGQSKTSPQKEEEGAEAAETDYSSAIIAAAEREKWWQSRCRSVFGMRNLDDWCGMGDEWRCAMCTSECV